MRVLVDTYLEARRLEIFEMGLAVNAAMSDNPKKSLNRILNPPRVWTLEDVPAMLRPAKKKAPADTS
jgi:hypothetical protein